MGRAEGANKVVNVASVPQRSPFRYPGGKSWLIPTARKWMASLDNPKILLEPFAGGASIGLLGAFEGYFERVLLVESAPDVAAVWQTILDSRNSKWLCNEIVSFDLTRESAIAELSIKPRSVRRLAFQTILRNRVQHGGILAPGAGLLKDGENGKGITSRWYPDTLAKRIRAIAEYGDEITFIHGDGLEEIRRHLSGPGVAMFLDPPYTASKKNAGNRLYLHSALDHRELFRLAAAHSGAILMTYDDDPSVRELATENHFQVSPVAMQNRHLARMNEILISKDLSWLDAE